MKKSKIIFVSFFLLLQTSCSYQLEGNEVPDNLIPKDTFTLVLHDVMVVESYFKSEQANVDLFYKSLPKAILTIFEKYNIDSTRYVESMNYYTTKQEVLIEMYNEIEKRISPDTTEVIQ